jgi:hypothetical protein
MSRRRLSRLLAASLMPLSALAVSGAASAIEEPVSRVVLNDPTGDVWATGDGELDEPVSAGDVPTADVVRAVVHHRYSSVAVKMTFTDLRRVEPQYYATMIASRRQYGAVFVSAGPGGWKGRHQLVDGNFATVRCPRLSHSIDYDTEQVTMRIPRGCIGRPSWVKVGMDNLMFRGGERDFQQISDNPHTAGADGRLTRRLYRQFG